MATTPIPSASRASIAAPPPAPGRAGVAARRGAGGAREGRGTAGRPRACRDAASRALRAGPRGPTSTTARCRARSPCRTARRGRPGDHRSGPGAEAAHAPGTPLRAHVPDRSRRPGHRRRTCGAGRSGGSSAQGAPFPESGRASCRAVLGGDGYCSLSPLRTGDLAPHRPANLSNPRPLRATDRAEEAGTWRDSKAGATPTLERPRVERAGRRPRCSTCTGGWCGSGCSRPRPARSRRPACCRASCTCTSARRRSRRGRWRRSPTPTRSPRPTAATGTRSPRARSSGPMFAELYGRVDGYCHGRGGSMHINDLSIGMLGANGIVGRRAADRGRRGVRRAVPRRRLDRDDVLRRRRQQHRRLPRGRQHGRRPRAARASSSARTTATPSSRRSRGTCCSRTSRTAPRRTACRAEVCDGMDAVAVARGRAPGPSSGPAPAGARRWSRPRPTATSTTRASRGCASPTAPRRRSTTGRPATRST